MKTKSIRLNPKKNGFGIVSSYSINIGVTEAKECGFIGDDGLPLDIEKIIDYENKQIIIKLRP